MNYIKTFEEYTSVEYEAPEKPKNSYKEDVKKKKRKDKGEGETIIVPPNHTKDAVSFGQA